MKTPFSEEILTVLYVLFRAGSALKSEHIVDALEDTSIDYFTAHQILEHLINTKSIFTVKQNGSDVYMLSPIGKDAIEQFYPLIRASVRGTIDKYLTENLSEMISSMEALSSCCFSCDNKYHVMLKSFDDNRCIMDITLTAEDSAAAELFMKNWSGAAPEIYSFIMEKLSKS